MNIIRKHVGDKKGENMGKIKLSHITAVKWARCLFIVLGIMVILIAPYLYLLQPAYKEIKLKIHKIEEKGTYIINKELPRLHDKLAGLPNQKSKEAITLNRYIQGLTQENLKLAQLKERLLPKFSTLLRATHILVGAIYLMAGLAIVSIFFSFMKALPSFFNNPDSIYHKRGPKRISKPLGSGKKDVFKDIMHTLARSLWISAPSLMVLCVALFLIIGSYAGNDIHAPSIFRMVLLLICGGVLAFTEILIPKRAEGSSGSDSWQLRETKLGRGIRRIFWAIAGILFFFMGSHVIEQKSGGVFRLSKTRLLWHSVLIILMVVVLWSGAGLLIGNVARLTAISPASFWGALWLGILTIIVCLLFMKIWHPGYMGKFFLGIRILHCPQCNQDQCCTWRPLSFQQSFLMQQVCKSCEVAMTRQGEKVDSTIHMKQIAKTLAVSIPFTVLSIALGIFVAGIGWNHAGRISLEKAKRELKNAGFSYVQPLNTQKPMDEENAAFWFQKAADAMEQSYASADGGLFYKDMTETDFFSYLFERLPKRTLSREELLHAQKFLHSHKEALNLLQKGTAKSQVHWGIDWDRPWYEREYPQFAYFTSLGKLLAIKAMVEAEEGNIAQSTETIQQGLMLADAVRSDPYLLSVLVSSSLYHALLRGARSFFPEVSPSDAKRLWTPYLESEEILSDFRTALQFELLGLTEWFAQLDWADRRLKYLEDPMILLYSPFLKLDAASYSHGITEKLKAFQLPYEAFESRWEKADRRFKKTVWTFGQLQSPYVKDFYSRILIVVADMRMAKTAIEAGRYIQKKGHWPEAVWELDQNKEYLEDPFTNGKLRLQKYRSGIIIYSVGPDMADDLGAPWDKDTRKGDLVWVLSSNHPL